MIKHSECGKEFSAVKVRFVAFINETLLGYSRGRLNIKFPLEAIQIYRNPSDLIDVPTLRTEIYCTECSKWTNVKEFEFYEACYLCGKKVRVYNYYCRKEKRKEMCLQCHKNRCIKLCEGKRGLCEIYREVLYRLKKQREGI